MIRQRFRTPLVVTAVSAAALLVVLAAGRGPRPVEAAGQEPRPKKAEKADARAPGAGVDEAAIRKAAANYVAALNRGDLDAVMAFWTPDAEYIDEAGTATRGKDNIAAVFRDVLPELKGSKVTGRQHSLRAIRPDVALEDGSLEFCGPDGCKEYNRYAVVWTRTDGKWLISSARDLPAEVGEVPSLAYPQLQALEWLVGEWADDTAKTDVKLTCRWAPNKAFLLMEYEIRREDQDPFRVTQRVGWDPHNEMIRSWVFDSDGGFAEGHWEKDGLRWVVESAGVLPDGGTGGATNVWEFVDDKTFVWRALDREVDGQPIGDIEVKFVRQPQK